MSKQLKVLIADDNGDDILLLEEAIHASGIGTVWNIVRDGHDAYRIINDSLLDANNGPDIAFIDINMPIRNGIELLKVIRENRQKPNLPVIIFTSSNREEDILLAYKYGVNSYVEKPSDFNELETCIKSILTYWALFD